MLQIIGHQKQIHYLDRSAELGYLSPSYIFLGPNGVGKSLVARWFAQRVLCTASASRPCGECGPCRRIESGNYPDFMQLNRAPKTKKSGGEEGGEDVATGEFKESIGIGDVRALIEGSLRKPMEGAFRFNILAEAERLTDEAQNGLLKTLEEPPSHLIIILCLDSLGRLLPTVVSRCNVVRFGEISQAEIASALESRGCDAERAALLAAITRNPGLALQMWQDEGLWQARQEVLEAIQQLAEADMWRALEVARSFEDMRAYPDNEGESQRFVLSVLRSVYGDALRMAVGGAPELCSNLDFREGYLALAERLGAEQLLKCLSAINAAEEYIAANVQPRLWWQELCLKVRG